MNRVLSMLSRLRRQRWWRVLAVTMLVPVVIFSTPTTSFAASSGTMTFSLEASGLETGIPGIGNTTCQLPWSVNAGGLIIGSSSRCDGGPDYSPGHCQPFEGACGSYSLVVKDSTGGTMGSTSFDPFDIGGGIGSVKAGLGGGYVPLGSGTASEACLSYSFSPAVGGATNVTSCVDLAVDPVEPTPTTGTCPMGSPRIKAEAHTIVHPQLGGDYRLTYHRFRLTVADADPFSSWAVATYLQNNQSSAFGSKVMLSTEWTDHNSGLGQTATWHTTQAPATLTGVLGVEVYANLPNWQTTSPLSSQARTMAASPNIPPTASGHNFGGWTDAQHCRFWFGQQMFQVDGTDGDLPAGGLDESVTAPPVEEVDPPVVVAPVDDTPDSDSGMWAAILAVLRAIAGAIGQLLTAVKNLVTALLDGIKGLFVPSDGFMESKWAGVDEKWQGTSPGRYMSALDDFSPGTVSGCAGLPLDVDLGHGIAIHEHIGGACSGAMASAAAVTRVVITAVFAIAGAVACVRAVGAGLGWDPGIGRGGAA